MIVSEVFAGKTYAVLGLARSGLATVETLLASGARVVAWDSQETAREAAIALGRSSRAKSRDVEDRSRERVSTSLDTNGCKVQLTRLTPPTPEISRTKHRYC